MSAIHQSNSRLWQAIREHRAAPDFATKSEIYDALSQRAEMRLPCSAAWLSATRAAIASQVRAYGRVENFQAVIAAGGAL